MTAPVLGLGWVLLGVVISTGCGTVPTKLDLRLLKELTSDLSKSVAISPFVMSTLMTQAWLAADGDTRDEISSVLGVSGDSFLTHYQTAIEYLTSGNNTNYSGLFHGVFLKAGPSVKPNYTTVLTTHYSRDVGRFSTGEQGAAVINSRASAATGGRVTQLITPAALNGASAALAGALVFQGLRNIDFYYKGDGSEMFLTASGEKPVNMVKVEFVMFEYLETATYDIVSIPYEDPDYSLLLLKPKKRTMAAVRSLRDSLDSIDIGDLVRNMTKNYMQVKLSPFNITGLHSGMKKALKKIGINRLFMPTADMGNMATSSAYVSTMAHKAFMEVTKEGYYPLYVFLYTFAAPYCFTLDRPFFAIVWNNRHKVNMVSAYISSP